MNPTSLDRFDRAAAVIDGLTISRENTLPTDEELEPVPITDDEGKRRKQSDILVDIGSRHHLFHDADVAYARMWVGTHHEVHAIESSAYREFLAHAYYKLVGKGCNRNALTDAITTISAKAKFEGPQEAVWLRTAKDGSDIVLDRGDGEWCVIRIAAACWSVVPTANVRFIRPGKMQALPTPVKAGFALLWKYLNVRPEDRVLVAAFLLVALRPSGPYPLLILSGEQGTGKSTFAKIIKRLVDPSAASLRSPPKESRDLLVGARNSWLLCIDNLSYLTAELSDALCRIATGGAISERTLYTNIEETVVEIERPVVINGIEDVATRPDLAERSLQIELETIVDRRSEREFWTAFDADAPAIFAGLLDALSTALRDVNGVEIDRLPRMADFAQWAAAGVPALGFTKGEFLAAYEMNLQHGMELGLESSAVGTAIEAFMRDRSTWSGSSNDLLKALSQLVGEPDNRVKNWPKSPKALLGQIGRVAPALRSAGITFARHRNANTRSIELCNARNKASEAPFASNGAPQPESHEPIDVSGSVDHAALNSPADDGYDTYDVSSSVLHDVARSNVIEVPI